MKILGIKTVLFYAVLLVASANLVGQTFVEEQEQTGHIDDFITEMMELHEIPGLAIAIIKKDSLLSEKYYGMANIEHSVPVNENTLFRIYSTTKLIVNTAIFQLIDQGKLSLNDRISKYLKQTPRQWREIQIRHLLAHTSGIPDFIQFNGKLTNEAMLEKLIGLPLEFETGEKHVYNQTNYWLFAKIIETISERSLEEYVQTNLFQSDKGVVFSSNSSLVIPNRISKYRYDFQHETYRTFSDEQPSRGFAGNGLNVTLKNLIHWSQQLNQDQYFSQKIKEAMWQPFRYSKSDYTFLHGWAVYPVNEIESYGFTGGGVSAIRFFPKQGLTIILITNGHKYYPIHNDIIDLLVGVLDKNLSDTPKKVSVQLADRFIKDVDFEAKAAIDIAKNTVKAGALEGVLNSLGYKLINQRHHRKAIAIFKANVEAFPESANVYDSLAEAYLYIDQFDNALENYKKSLKLDPNNENAKNMIGRIEERMKSLK